MAAPGDQAIAPDVRYGSDSGPWVVAHRGGAGLALENTLAAFARSTALGVRHLETDVRATADGVCVAFHDAGLRRLAGVPGRLADLPWSRVARLRLAGDGRVARLEEVLEAFPDARVMVDLKERRAIPALARAVRSCRAQARVCLAGTDDDVLADAAAVLGPGVQAAMGWRSTGRLVAAARFGTRPRGVVPAPFVHVPLRLGRVPVFVERLVDLAADLGGRVLVWTVDRPADMRRLLDAGVQGIITDRPDVAREVLVARGQWRPLPDAGVSRPRAGRAPAPPGRAAVPAPALPRPAPTTA